MSFCIENVTTRVDSTFPMWIVYDGVVIPLTMDEVGRVKDEVEVLDCLGQEEGLHTIFEGQGRHVTDLITQDS